MDTFRDICLICGEKSDRRIHQRKSVNIGWHDWWRDEEYSYWALTWEERHPFPLLSGIMKILGWGDKQKILLALRAQTTNIFMEWREGAFIEGKSQKIVNLVKFHNLHHSLYYLFYLFYNIIWLSMSHSLSLLQENYERKMLILGLGLKELSEASQEVTSTGIFSWSQMTAEKEK